VADALAVGQPTVVKLEMVHASWQMRGLLDPLPLSFLYDTGEDFFAILLANVYASESGRAVGLRSDHHGFEHLNTDIDHLYVLPSSQGQGETRTCRHVRFSAARGGEADVSRRMRAVAIYEYAS
jgi:hypothetical protein